LVLLWRIVVVNINKFIVVRYMLCYYGASKAVNLCRMWRNPPILSNLKCASSLDEYISRALTAQVFRSFSSSTIHILPKNKRYIKSKYVLLPQESMLLRISSFGQVEERAIFTCFLKPARCKRAFFYNS
jgi:hypothetical protein